MNESSEGRVVQKTMVPLSKTKLVKAFSQIGLAAGDQIIVHSALSRLGWVIGGPRAVVEALMEVITPEGVIIMPGHSSDNSEPSYWYHPPVPESWWPEIRNHMPAYDPRTTPTRGVGKIPEVFRTYPNVFRSLHPQQSFSVWGKDAATIAAHHALTPCFGRDSPLFYLYQHQGKVLLLGVDHGNDTSLHLAEVLAVGNSFPCETQGAAVLQDGMRQWITWEDLDYNSDDFANIGDAYEQTIRYEIQHIGNADVRFLSVGSLVDFAVDWIHEHRTFPVSTAKNA